MTKRTKPTSTPYIHSALKDFDDMPDSAGVRLPVVCGLFGISGPTAWRWSRSGHLPAPSKVCNVTLWNVGALRAVMSKQAA